jgi:hypothetical protein
VNPAPRQHTPGPWTVDNQYIHGPDGIRFLAVAGDGAGQANARLIAAAPELLAAARLAVAWSEQVPAPYRDWPHVAAARAAIAKATGGAA